MKAMRGPGQRAGLTRDTVVAAAQELVAQTGAAGLTMRALARHLGVAPNALYSHVENKTALLDLLLDELLADLPAPSPDVADPLAGLSELMTATYTTLTANPDLVPLYLQRQGARGPHALRLGQVMDDLLARTGLSAAGAAAARRALIIHAIGSAAFATGPPAAPDADRALSPRQSHNTFVRSLRWLLAGIAGESNRHSAS